jgi:glycine cleavage system H protein
MKQMSEFKLPDDVRYSEDHEWVRLEGDAIRVGISDYAQDQLGDITFVGMPNIADTFDRKQEFGTVESTKAVSELFMPLGGKVLEVNEALEESPGLVNEDPYGRGWLILVKPNNPDEFNSLMTKGDYAKRLKGAE